MSQISRRDALKRSLVVLAAVPAVLEACKKDEALTCTNTSGLSAVELAARTSLNYADRSADPNKACSRSFQLQPRRGPRCSTRCCVAANCERER
jgi:hypothetical protein